MNLRRDGGVEDGPSWNVWGFCRSFKENAEAAVVTDSVPAPAAGVTCELSTGAVVIGADAHVAKSFPFCTVVIVFGNDDVIRFAGGSFVSTCMLILSADGDT